MSESAGARIDGRTLLRRVAVILGIATLLCVAVATQNFSAFRLAGRPMEWTTMFVAEMPVWYGWALMTPLVFAISRRFPLPGKAIHLAAHLVGSFVSVLLVLALVVVWRRATGLLPEGDGLSFAAILWVVVRSAFAAMLLVYWMIVLAERAIAASRRARVRELEALRLEARLQESQLENLRAQLHPHFLFNALHAISALMRKDVPAARTMMARLSDLLRLSLDTRGDHLVPLSREVELLETWVGLQTMRFGERLEVSLDIDPRAKSVPVPRLILQPLAENSVRHGLEARSGGCRISIRAALSNGSLHLQVVDDGPGFPAEVRERIGLGNTRQRLAALFGEGASLDVRNRPEGGAEVNVVIPATEGVSV